MTTPISVLSGRACMCVMSRHHSQILGPKGLHVIIIKHVGMVMGVVYHSHTHRNLFWLI